MSETDLLLTTLKRRLRAQGITYGAVAAALSLSEASVKRLFAGRRFTLERLEAVCELTGTSLTGLAREVAAQREALKTLGAEQEAILAADLPLLLVFFLLLNDYSFEMIVAEYTLSDTDCFRLLRRLEQMELIDLLPGNRVRLKVSRALAWRSDGPIRRFFEQSIRREFMHSDFSEPGQRFVFLAGMLTDESIIQLDRRLDALATTFNDLLREDGTARIEQRHGYSMLLAVRNWQFSLFENMKRNPASDAG